MKALKFMPFSLATPWIHFRYWLQVQQLLQVNFPVVSGKLSSVQKKSALTETYISNFVSVALNPDGVFHLKTEKCILIPQRSNALRILSIPVSIGAAIAHSLLDEILNHFGSFGGHLLTLLGNIQMIDIKRIFAVGTGFVSEDSN